MEILFCGTSAAEAWPALFCECAVCVEARIRGGKDIRSRAAYMLDDRVRIDFGPDSNYHHHKYGLALDRLEHLLVSHSHDDHWFPRDLMYREKGFSVVPSTPLRVWGNDAVERRFVESNGDDWARYGLEFHQITTWKSIDLGQGVTATPILAAHDPKEECVNYRIEAGGRAALFGHDTGWYAESTWGFLESKPLNVVVLDCTYGSRNHDRGHLGCADVVRARDELARRGSLAPNARVFATHFSHNGGWLHEDLERFLTPHDVAVAFDGLRITL